MFNYYDIEVIPIILNQFKVNDVIICGISDKIVLNKIFEYCDDENVSYTAIDSNKSLNDNFIEGHVLNELPKLNNYDAIFINDDPNWYSVYNELNIIKKNNDHFPLVFICNNVFPHKRRDSYINPESIPEEFRKEYSKELILEGIHIYDSFYHALEENTPKNGVQTAIEDFLSENGTIGLMDIKFLNGIVILYPLNGISHLRLGKLNDELEDYNIDFDDVSDNIIENKLLVDYFSKLPISNDDLDLIENLKKVLCEKDQIIKDFEHKMDINNAELNYKNSKIRGFDSKLDLKDSQIKNIESKLVNSENKINNLNSELELANNLIKDNKNKLNEKNKVISLKDNQLRLKQDELTEKINEKNKVISLKDDQLRLKQDELDAKLNEVRKVISLKDDQLRLKQDELDENIVKLNSLKDCNTRQLGKLEGKEYCISCYKEEISNNHLEIQYLKKKTLLRKLLSPFAYLYLIFRSNPGELSLNFKLYKALKNSKCFDIGYYLNNNEDVREGKWCNYFSPELHYVCNGFNEERRFNKKYFNRNSKEELLEYIINCP